MIVAFICFAAVNLGALREVDQQRIDARDLIEKRAFKKESAPDETSLSTILHHLNPPGLSGLTVFHVTGDILTIAAILILWRLRSVG